MKCGMIFALYSIRGDIMIAIPRTIEPEVCTYLDDQRSCLIIETVLPGVRRLDILLKVNSRCMIISAVTGTITYQKYLAFIQPVIPDQTNARFEHELLRVVIPLRE